MKKESRENNVARRLLTDEKLEQVAGGAAEKPELELDDASEDGMKSQEELDEIDKASDPLSEIMQILI